MLNSRIARNSNIEVDATIDTSSLIMTYGATALCLCLSRFPEIVKLTMLQSDPSFLAKYLVDLSKQVASAQSFIRVKNVDTKIAGPRKLLFDCTAKVLYEGLALLGLKPIEEM